ncbi:MAG: GGDEF domain-containing protein, partial [Chloroflexi bacterium]|nr:GGDEF domain-containing protein [Chloroflexota bacterium]
MLNTTEQPDGISQAEALLRAIPVFASLPELALVHLAEQAKTLSFPRHAPICRKGDAGDSLFIVKSGSVDIIMPEEDGQETCLASLAPGEFFGELAVLDGQPRSATARSGADSEVLVLHRDQLFPILREPNVLENLLIVLTRRVRAADELVRERGIDNRKLEEEALTDALTGLGNRRKLRRDLDELEARCQRYDHSYALAMCDVDHFKRYNDTYGHAKGDEVLRAVAQTMARSCRTGDEVYRYGGEEFVVVMPSQTEDSAWTGMDRLRRAVELLAIPHTGNPPLHVVTFSGGV